jgi:hypothetical protein
MEQNMNKKDETRENAMDELVQDVMSLLVLGSFIVTVALWIGAL